ncbi:TniQ family protein [Salinarimonas sp. NSM]|uniref:TniQ family protein n=1 Tax=Salinarimonas sp. NSM TaxID=3458003 RepID=UPI004036B02D
MTSLLVLPVPIVDGEPFASFVSRLAARNTGGLPRAFAETLGIPWQDVIDATDDARAVVAGHLKVDPATIGAAGPRRVGERTFLFEAERVPRTFLRRAGIHACPACLRDDLATRGGRPEIACTQRATWQIAHLRTCPVHRLSIVQIGAAATPERLGDFAETIRRAWPHLNALAAKAVAREPSGLETYILDRLAGRSGPAWLDANTLYAAARACEMIGAVAIHGAHVKIDDLEDDAWHRAGAAGYDIAAGGEDRIRDFLADVRDACPSDAGQIGMRVIFGTLNEWLAHGDEIGEAGPLRDVLRRFVTDTMPVGPGDVVLGHTVQHRTLHSVYTLHKTSGAHPKRLRKILVDAGLVTADDPRSDHLVTVPASAGEAVAGRVAGALSLKQVEGYLNCPRVHTKLLEERGFITPVVDAEHRGRLAKHAFATADLDDFLERLLARAAPMPAPGEGIVPIPGAAKRACCSAMEIVRLVLDGTLHKLGRDPLVEGYLSLLVDVEEVRRHTRLEVEPVGVPLREAERRLRTSTAVIEALIAPGPDGEAPILETVTAINPVNRCPQVVVPFAALEAFEREYVGLMALAKETGIHQVQLRKRLDVAGVVPAFEPDRVGARFYARAAISTLFGGDKIGITCH